MVLAWQICLLLGGVRQCSRQVLTLSLLDRIRGLAWVNVKDVSLWSVKRQKPGRKLEYLS
jgi:hypothetical protein